MFTSTCVNAHGVYVCVRAIETEVAHTSSSPDCEISFSEPAICEIDGAICLPVIAIQSWPRVARLKRLENRFSVLQSSARRMDEACTRVPRVLKYGGNVRYTVNVTVP